MLIGVVDNLFINFLYACCLVLIGILAIPAVYIIGGLALMLLFGRGYRVVKSIEIEKYADKDIRGSRLSPAPDGGVYALIRYGGYGETELMKFDRDGTHVKSLDIPGEARTLLHGDGGDTFEDFYFQDLDVSASGELLVLASVRSLDLSEEDAGYYWYDGRPVATVIFRFNALDGLAGIIKVEEAFPLEHMTGITAANGDIFIGGSQCIYKVDDNGKIVARCDLPSAGEKKSAICVATDGIVAATGGGDVVFLTKGLRPARQWEAKFLGKPIGNIVSVGADRNDDVYIAGSGWSTLGRYSRDGAFKGRLGNVVYGKRAFDPCDIAVDGDGRAYVLDSRFVNEIVVLERRR